MTKSELRSWLQEQYQRWEALLDRIGPARMDRPGVNGAWSMKDLVAHLTGWNRWLVARLQAAHRGDPAPLPPWPAHLETEDEINAWLYESNRERSVHQVLDDSRRVFQQLLAVIEGLPDDVRIERVDPAYYLVWVGDERFLAGEFFDHWHDDHEPDVHAWLARMESPRYTCPICGYPGLDEAPRDLQTGDPTYNICPCCGGEFGYNDVTETANMAHRRAWILQGARWFRPALKPPNWDLGAQLRAIGVNVNDILEE